MTTPETTITNAPPKKTLSDKEIVELIVHHKRRDLLEVLYERYAKLVYFKCLSLTKSESTAKDLSHDILIKVFTKLNQYKGKSAFSLWVYAISYNHCMTFLKKRNKHKIEAYDNMNEVMEDTEELEQKMLKEMKLEQLERLFLDLNVEDRGILMMYYKDNISVKSIATILKIKNSAVKMRLKRARERLAILFKNDNNGRG